MLAKRLITPGDPYLAAGGFCFAIDPDDKFQATMMTGLFDRLAEAVLRGHTRAGATVIDAGAHLGYFTLRLGRWVGPSGSVHAFEPDPRLFPRLLAHVQQNDMPWITVNECGLLDGSTEEVELTLPSQLGWASVVPGAWGSSQRIPARMVALDEYVETRGIDPAQITLIKIDVEGAEPAALAGASRTLAASRAAVLIEFIPERIRELGGDPDEVLAAMTDHGYQPWVPVPSRRGFTLQAGVRPEVGEDVLFLARGSSPIASG